MARCFAVTVALCLLSAAALAQTPRSSLTGFVIDGAHAGQAIGVVVTPNPQIRNSDEISTDRLLKWKSRIPIVVWRQRRIAGDYRLCPVATFQFEFVPLAQEIESQVFVIPASAVREFDHFLFEYRSWYSIGTSLPGTSGLILPSTAPLRPTGFTINCSDDPRFKE